MKDAIHNTRVRTDGTVAGHPAETYYVRAERVFLEDDYVCIVADNGATDVETRVPRDVLERLFRGEIEPEGGR